MACGAAWRWRLSLLALVVGATAFAGAAEGRTRTFCGFVSRDCGRHLQPECTSGAPCDSGFQRYSGSPFPITIDCPAPIPDTTVRSGCYETIPSCDDCGGQGQFPCPQETARFCTPGCDSGYRQGLDLKCNRLRTLGEGCSVVNPCLDSLNCQPCFGCDSPLQCFPQDVGVPFSDEDCEALYSPDLHKGAYDLGLTTTYGAGLAGSVGVSDTFESGTAYGPLGEYGCFATSCIGGETNVGSNLFTSVGFYDGYENLPGLSLSIVETAGLLVSFSTSQIIGNGGAGALIGTEDAFSIGVSILPISAGVYSCTTSLSTLRDGNATPLPTRTPLPDLCDGDCNGDDSVSVGELVIGVGIALGRQLLPRCSSFDVNGNGRVEVSELVRAVRNALGGC